MEIERVTHPAHEASAGTARNARREIVAMILFVVAVSVVVLLALRRIEHESRLGVKAALKTVLRTTEEALDLWESQHVEKVKTWARDPRIVDAARSLVGLDRSGQPCQAPGATGPSGLPGPATPKNR